MLVTTWLPFLPGCEFIREGIGTYFMVEFSTYSKNPAPRTVLVLVTESCVTLCDPLDCSLLGFSNLRILQPRMLEGVAVPSSRGSS